MPGQRGHTRDDLRATRRISLVNVQEVGRPFNSRRTVTNDIQADRQGRQASSATLIRFPGSARLVRLASVEWHGHALRYRQLTILVGDHRPLFKYETKSITFRNKITPFRPPVYRPRDAIDRKRAMTCGIRILLRAINKDPRGIFHLLRTDSIDQRFRHVARGFAYNLVRHLVVLLFRRACLPFRFQLRRGVASAFALGTRRTASKFNVVSSSTRVNLKAYFRVVDRSRLRAASLKIGPRFRSVTRNKRLNKRITKDGFRRAGRELVLEGTKRATFRSVLREVLSHHAPRYAVRRRRRFVERSFKHARHLFFFSFLT